MKKRILVIDDDLIYQQIIRKLLGKNYDLFITDDFNDAQNELTSGVTPDLIIADLNLPGMNGEKLIEDLCDNLKSDKQNIIVISGMEDDKLNTRLKDIGVSYILTKPVDRKLLSEKINSLIG